MLRFFADEPLDAGVDTFKHNHPTLKIVLEITLSVLTLNFVSGAWNKAFADTITILYTYPFLLTRIAVMYLGERVRLSG
ncbi:MAG: hypothetical protein OXE41_09980 [Gammaproteobacteria bacterium]|nr:hypothetical protein [Gammaproteobacteria bacterium]MCY4275701.1 hypothetical protein [Gammaproteobacteria bacterium]